MGGRRILGSGLATLASLVALAAAGCASYQRVHVTSDPQGAEIWLDGEMIGHTPAQIRPDRLDSHTVFVKKQGYRSELIVLELRSAPDRIDFLVPPDIDARLAPRTDALDAADGEAGDGGGAGAAGSGNPGEGADADGRDLDRKLRIEVDRER